MYTEINEKLNKELTIYKYTFNRKIERDVFRKYKKGMLKK